MTTKSDLDDLADELAGSIKMLLESQYERTGLILLLSAIDILGTLASADGRASPASFIAWSDRYLEPKAALGCSSVELYAARCGVVHSLGAESSLSSSGKAREVVWASGRTMPSQTNDPRFCILHVAVFYQTLQQGMRRWVAEVKGDPARLAAVEANLERVYVTRGGG